MLSDTFASPKKKSSNFGEIEIRRCGEGSEEEKSGWLAGPPLGGMVPGFSEAWKWLCPETTTELSHC